MTELTFFSSVSGYFRLWRYQPTLVLVLFSFMYFGWIALAGGIEDFRTSHIVKIGFGWFAATAVLLAMFLINDAADREIDKVVHPDRPIPRGISDWRHIYVLGILFLVFAIFLSTAVNRRSTLVALAMALLTVAHYGYLKRRLTLPGSSEIITPVMSALFPLYALSVAKCEDTMLAALLILFIYLADFSHDLLGGIHDQAGDRRQNVHTFATAFGSRVTLLISFCSFLLASVAAFLLYRTSSLGFVYLLIFVGLTLYLLIQYWGLFRLADGAALAVKAGKVNHLGGGYFFLVSASTFVDFLARRFFGQ